MHNVHELERRWLRYKIKSYIPHFLTAMAAVIISLTLYIYLPVEVPKNKSVLKVEVEHENIPEQIVLETKKEIAIPLEVMQNTVQVQREPTVSLVLEPSLHFMDNIEDGLNPYISEDASNVLNTVDNTNKSPFEPIQEGIEINPPTEEKKTLITMTKNQDETDLKDVIRRFKQNKNPSLSLFIAKRYYDLGQYQKSYNYALMTNEIDKSIEESWLVFSKSLVKLGQHELAILTLKSYLKTNKSTQAETLLRKIESGDFK